MQGDGVGCRPRRVGRTQNWEDLQRLVGPEGNFAVYRHVLKNSAYVAGPRRPGAAASQRRD